jgi:hypothetical protein
MRFRECEYALAMPIATADAPVAKLLSCIPRGPSLTFWPSSMRGYKPRFPVGAAPLLSQAVGQQTNQCSENNNVNMEISPSIQS